MDIDDIYLAGKNAAYDIAAKKLLASRKILGNADSIAESDFIWIFIHSVVDILLKQLAIRALCLLALYKNPRMKSDNDLISVSLKMAYLKI